MVVRRACVPPSSPIPVLNALELPYCEAGAYGSIGRGGSRGQEGWLYSCLSRAAFLGFLEGPGMVRPPPHFPRADLANCLLECCSIECLKLAAARAEEGGDR